MLVWLEILAKPITVLQKQVLLAWQKLLQRNMQAETLMWVSRFLIYFFILVLVIIYLKNSCSWCCIWNPHLSMYILSGQCYCTRIHRVWYDRQAWRRPRKEDLGENPVRWKMILQAICFFWFSISDSSNFLFHCLVFCQAKSSRAWIFAGFEVFCGKYY